MNFENMSCSRPARMNIDRQISFYDENLNSILGTNFFHRVVDFAVSTYKVEAGRATKMFSEGAAHTWKSSRLEGC